MRRIVLAGSGAEKAEIGSSFRRYWARSCTLTAGPPTKRPTDREATHASDYCAAERDDVPAVLHLGLLVRHSGHLPGSQLSCDRRPDRAGLLDAVLGRDHRPVH